MSTSLNRRWCGIGISLAMLIPTGVSAEEILTPESYTFPNQPGKDQLAQVDPENKLLTDNLAGPGSKGLWGEFGVARLITDFRFESYVKIEKITLGIIHTNREQAVSHVSQIILTPVGDDGEPVEAGTELSFEIPFENGEYQKAEIDVSPEFLAKNLRMTFVSNGSQVAVDEVTFSGTKADPSANEKSSRAPITPLPAPFARSSLKNSSHSMFGMSMHFLHTDFFYPGRYTPYWRVEYVLPFVVNGNLGWVREPLYPGYFINFASEDLSLDGICKDNGKTFLENRQHIEACIQAYQDAGLSVMLMPYLPETGPFKGERPKAYTQWLASLIDRFECIKVVEMGGEANLEESTKTEAGLKDFVAAQNDFAKILRQAKRKVPLILGGPSGWGSRVDEVGVKALVKTPKEFAMGWMEMALKAGILDALDGISAHPYRPGAPESGDVMESQTDPDGFEKELQLFIDLVNKYAAPDKKNLPIYLTEIGYSVLPADQGYGYCRVPTEERQADYYSRFALNLFDLRLKGYPIEMVAWYDIKQDQMPAGSNAAYEANFGLISTNLERVRPAYIALQRVAGAFADPKEFKKLDWPLTFSEKSKQSRASIWQNTSSGHIFVPFWRLNQMQFNDVDFLSEMSLTLPEGFEVDSISLVDLHENVPRKIGFKTDGPKISVPLWLTARAAWLEITPKKSSP